MPPRYPFPWFVAIRLAGALINREKRSFHQDASRSASLLSPPIRISCEVNFPITGPSLITVNHYSRPGFRAWWLALGISAVVSAEIHWVITSAWTYPDKLRTHLITPLTSNALRHIAQMYNFTCMPPMPPRIEDTQERAAAVRRVIALAKSSSQTIIGFAPEGRDPTIEDVYSPTTPPPGVGRLIYHLARLDYMIFPVAAFEADDRFCLNFGSPYRLNPPPGLNKNELDLWVSQVVMARIANLLAANET